MDIQEVLGELEQIHERNVRAAKMGLNDAPVTDQFIADAENRLGNARAALLAYQKLMDLAIETNS